MKLTTPGLNLDRGESLFLSGMLEQQQYETVVGLEVHAQLLTNTKLFCADTTLFGTEANTQVSAVSLAHPGTLPKMNKAAIELAIRLGLATQSHIVQKNYFARKNYFYPDLPKGYQITQHTTPICTGGFVEVTAGSAIRKIRLNRIHIEEDAGKSLHDDGSAYSLLDYNRAGMPLVEIVSEPDISSAEEAASFVSNVRKLVRHLGVCNGNMEEGSLRCDVNISVRKRGDTTLGTKVEIKNLNSIRFIKKAIEFEATQLIEKCIRGEAILQQTKGFDENSGSTYSIRTKEDEDDYRYFPEPDLPPFYISDSELNTIRSNMPALPAQLQESLVKKFQLSEYDAALLANDIDLANYFEQLTSQTKYYKAAANWVLGPIKNHLQENDLSVENFPVAANAITQLIELIENGIISYGIATQQIFIHLLNHPATNIEAYIQKENLQLQTGNAVDDMIAAALTRHAQKIADYKKGKKGLISVFVGEVMRLSKGKANAEEVTKKLLEKLNS